jgi:hypothetical protein
MGAPWVQDFRLVPAKIFMGFWAQDYWTKYRGDGWFSEKRYSLVEQRVCDQMPGIRDHFESLSRATSSFGHLLMRRGAFCLPEVQYKDGNDELGRFRVPEWGATFQKMRELFVNKTTVLRLDELLHLQQTRMIIESTGYPCVYMRHDPDKPRDVYVGMTTDIEKRDHSNAAHWLFTVWSTSTVKLASSIETHLHRWLEYEKCIRKGVSKSDRGYWITPWNNPVLRINSHVQTYYGELVHNTNTLVMKD